MKIAVVGAGTVGASWAAAFAAGGHDVTLADSAADQLAHGLERSHVALRMLESAGRSDPPEDGRPAIQGSTDVRAAVSAADYVQESIGETVVAKRALFLELDAWIRPGTILGSSTSSIAGSSFMSGLSNSSGCLVVHPTNPPHVIPLVELCRIPETSESSFATVQQLLDSVGMVGIEVKREIRGYVLNRLQAAVVGEALHLVGEGYVSGADLDQVMALGLAPRWALGGPFLAGHLNAPGGYRDYMTRYADVYRGIIADLQVDHPWTPEVIDAIDTEVSRSYAGQSITALADRRDAALIALEQSLAPLRRYVSTREQTEMPPGNGGPSGMKGRVTT